VRASFDLGGFLWPLDRPPASAVPSLAVIQGNLDFAWLVAFLSHHVEDDYRGAFGRTLTDTEGMDVGWLMESVGRFSDGLYDGLPLGALLTLWSLWPESRHVVHGRLLAAGHPHGADDLNAYDVACLMWAQLEVERGIHNPFAKPSDARDAAESLRSSLMSMNARPGATRSDVDEFRELLNRNAPVLQIVADHPDPSPETPPAST
jgi:hypothetical protein